MALSDSLQKIITPITFRPKLNVSKANHRQRPLWRINQYGASRVTMCHRWHSLRSSPHSMKVTPVRVGSKVYPLLYSIFSRERTIFRYILKKYVDRKKSHFVTTVDFLKNGSYYFSHLPFFCLKEKVRMLTIPCGGKNPLKNDIVP